MLESENYVKLLQLLAPVISAFQLNFTLLPKALESVVIMRNLVLVYFSILELQIPVSCRRTIGVVWQPLRPSNPSVCPYNPHSSD